MRNLLIVMVLVASLFPLPADAHGVRTYVVAGDTTVVTVTHEDGEPLAGASFTVRAPGSDGPFKQGTTDAQGRLIFHPDRPGDWRVRVATADGHGAVVTVAIAPPAGVGVAPGPSASVIDTTTGTTAPAARAATSSAAPRSFRALAGALLLVGLFALGARLVRGRAR